MIKHPSLCEKHKRGLSRRKDLESHFRVAIKTIADVEGSAASGWLRKDPHLVSPTLISACVRKRAPPPSHSTVWSVKKPKGDVCSSLFEWIRIALARPWKQDFACKGAPCLNDLRYPRNRNQKGEGKLPAFPNLESEAADPSSTPPIHSPLPHVWPTFSPHRPLSSKERTTSPKQSFPPHSPFKQRGLASPFPNEPLLTPNSNLEPYLKSSQVSSKVSTYKVFGSLHTSGERGI